VPLELVQTFVVCSHKETTIAMAYLFVAFLVHRQHLRDVSRSFRLYVIVSVALCGLLAAYHGDVFSCGLLPQVK
jgi:hypothetical protein